MSPLRSLISTLAFSLGAIAVLVLTGTIWDIAYLLFG